MKNDIIVYKDVENVIYRSYRLFYERYKLHKIFLLILKEEGLLPLYFSRSSYTRSEKLMFKKIKRYVEKKRFHTVDEMIDLMNDYFEEMDNAPTEIVSMTTAKKAVVTGRKPYTVEGLCNYLGMSKKMFYNYGNDPEYSEYHYIIEMARQTITAKVLEGSLLNEFNSGIAKFYLKNVSDLEEKKNNSQLGAIGDVTFITVNSREDLKQLKEGKDFCEGEIIEAEPIEDIDPEDMF